MQNLLSLPLTGGLLLAPMGHAPVAMVDARDVAACAVAALTGSDGDGAWHLTGPAGVTFADVAPHLGARRYLNLPRKVAATAMRRRGAAAVRGRARHRHGGISGLGRRRCPDERRPPADRPSAAVARAVLQRRERHMTPMVTRMGHIALRVPDLDASVAFQQDVLGMVETERSAGVSYLTCNERHHELMLIQDPVRRGYDHIARGRGCSGARGGDRARGRGRSDHRRRLRRRAGHRPRGARARPGGHVFKLFCGMETVAAPPGRPSREVRARVREGAQDEAARTLPAAGLGFRFSDRLGTTASWWHCDEDHHGMAIVRAPRSELSHYASRSRT